MTSRHHRVSRLVAVAAAAASLAAPLTAVAESGDGQVGPTVADVFTDPAIVARHKALGRLGEPRRSNTALGNDIAHFGRSDTATVLGNRLRRSSYASMEGSTGRPPASVQQGDSDSCSWSPPRHPPFDVGSASTQPEPKRAFRKGQ